MAGRRGRRRKKQPAFRGGLLVVVLVIAVPLLVWGAYGWLRTDGDDPSAGHDDHKVRPTETAEPDDEGETGDVTEPGEGETGGDQEPLDACVDHLKAGTAVVDEASTGADHWGTHIGARAAWIAGEISEEEKAARYKKTRLAGPADQERFKAALEQYESSGTCDDLAALADGGAGGEKEDVVQACMDRAELTTAAIETGSTVMGDWQGHLDAMAAFADHEMTTDESNAMWVEAAESAPPRIKAFEDARDDLEQAPECAGGTA